MVAFQERNRKMKIVESTDHFLQTVYRIEEDDGHLIATFDNRHDAEVAKAALEKDREEQSKNQSYW